MAKKKKPAKRKTTKPVKKRAIYKPKKTTKMAKRKKGSTKRRRRSIGATGTDLTTIATMAAGAIVGRMLANKLAGKMNPKILAGAQIAVGAYIMPQFIKNPLAKAAGAGMAVNGAVDLVKGFGIISGMDETVQMDFVGELQQTIAGPGLNNEIAGTDDDDDGDGMAGTDDDLVQEYEYRSGMGRINDSGDDDDE